MPHVETTRLLRDLVMIPSVNPMGRSLQGPEFLEHRVTAYLEEFFRNLGVPYEKQTCAPLRENVVARTEFTGARKTLVLEVHQDTVPTDGMTIEPFAARMEGGKLYGRGACDIKGGMAAMLAAFARIVREKPGGAMNVVMACSVDEEFTFMGVRRLVEGMKADFAVVAEPTRLQIVDSHKGCVRWHMHTQGRSCHSSNPEQGVNAIYRMGRLVSAIERYAERLRATKTDPRLGPATMSVGRIEGGTSVNVVPEHCRIEIDRRVLPGEDPFEAPEQLVNFLRSEGGIDFPFQCDKPWMGKKALEPKGAGEITARLGRAIDQVAGPHQITAVAYGTDASTISASGIPAVVFGPGDIAQAHTCDEWVELEEVERAAEILFHLAADG